MGSRRWRRIRAVVRELDEDSVKSSGGQAMCPCPAAHRIWRYVYDLLACEHQLHGVWRVAVQSTNWPACATPSLCRLHLAAPLCITTIRSREFLVSDNTAEC
ncbi:unnamed protein product [Urochloa humidicola]